MITSNKASRGRVISVKPRKIDALKEEQFDCDSIRDPSFIQKMIDLGFDGTLSFKESNKYWDFTQVDLVSSIPEYTLWHHHIPISDVSISGAIVKGFKRGSKQLGCPTANIEMTHENIALTQSLVPGVYSAFGIFDNPTVPFIEKGKKYMCALSIGWNPVYENAEKTVEVYIMNDFGKDNDFYGQQLRVDLQSFMRAEVLFPSFDDLINAIQCDVEAAKAYLTKRMVI